MLFLDRQLLKFSFKVIKCTYVFDEIQNSFLSNIFNCFHRGINIMKEFFKKYKHGLVFLYMFIYFPWFSYVEKKVTTEFNEIHMPIDDVIPFCAVFIIPYLLWFVYVAGFAVYFFFKDAGEFVRMCIFLGVGMTLFLIISTVYPNGHYLRPETFANDNIFTQLVGMLYRTDTATNILPSIHIYNSLAVGIAVIYSKHLKKLWVQIPSFVLMVLIIMSTVFLKQHSMWDVITAFILAAVMWLLLYSPISIKVRK